MIHEEVQPSIKDPDVYLHNQDELDSVVRICDLPIVYLVATFDPKFIKVGYASNFKDRFGAIQCGCPHNLFLWRAVRTPSPARVEAHMHRVLDHARVRGEWFTFSEEDFNWVERFTDNTNAAVAQAVRNAKSQAPACFH